MSPANRALWLNAKQDAEMIINEAPYPSLASNELVIKTKAVAINPADVILQKAGVLLTHYPAILGCDAAGIVQEVSPDLAHMFKPGDRVFGTAIRPEATSVLLSRIMSCWNRRCWLKFLTKQITAMLLYFHLVPILQLRACLRCKR